MLSVSESESVTLRVCARAKLLHLRRVGIVVLTASLGALLGLPELGLFIRPHLGPLADLRLALRRVDELALGLVELRRRLRVSLAVIAALLFHRCAPGFVLNDLDISFHRRAAHCESPAEPSDVGDI